MAELRELRIKAGYTQAELAKKLHVDQSTISTWESGIYVPLTKCWPKLAKVLGVQLKDLKKLWPDGSPKKGVRM